MTSFNFGFLPTMLIMPAVENPRQLTRPFVVFTYGRSAAQWL